MGPIRKNSKGDQKGAGILEALIALTILAIGAAGLASMFYYYANKSASYTAIVQSQQANQGNLYQTGQNTTTVTATVTISGATESVPVIVESGNNPEVSTYDAYPQ